MDFNKLPSKPVVKSLTSAQAEWDNWLLQNNFDILLDGDGIEWRLAMTFDQQTSAIDKHKGKWTTTLQLGVDVPVQKLIETGSLDRINDARLIGMAGTGKVPLRMKKLKYEAAGELNMRDVLVQVLPELRDNLRKTSLHEIKRGLFCRWLDGLCQFGEREAQGIERNLSEDEIVNF